MSETQLVVLGAGNMGEALLRGVLGANLIGADSIVAVEPRDERRDEIASALSIAAVADVADAPPAAVYVLAVKPQQMEAVLPSLAAAIPESGALVISIAAGISTAYLADSLGAAARIIRTMPNTPMLVGCGCTGLAAGPGATDADMAMARKLFSTSGEVMVVDEPAIDAVTAVSGSGPAYFFYLVEAMTAAGLAEGLDADTALALARQTCAGAAKLMIESGEDPATLRAKVTSPGGATQAAIESMDAAGVKDALTAAVRAAAARSRELGK